MPYQLGYTPLWASYYTEEFSDCNCFSRILIIIILASQNSSLLYRQRMGDNSLTRGWIVYHMSLYFRGHCFRNR